MSAPAVVISVFGLFHPSVIEIAPVRPSAAITVQCPGSGTPLRLEGKQFRRLGPGCQATGEFLLRIPGRIERAFRGAVRVEPGLTALVTMDLETAVASVVASELPADAPPAAMEAQAIAARSYYMATPQGRHRLGTFCDSTHCQHIRGMLDSDHPAALAAQRTRGLILDYESRILAAMYSAACQGKRQTGAVNPDGYPYFAVECPFCRRKPVAKPGAHSRGLCQAGAIDMARLKGKSAREILAYYYPGTRVRPLRSE
jgi:hypothetical protein